MLILNACFSRETSVNIKELYSVNVGIFFQTKHVIFVLLSLFMSRGLFAEQYQDIYIEPAPKWVEIRDITLNPVTPVDEITDGVFYQLLDTQIKVSDSDKIERYSRYIETIANQAGVDYSSQINLDFDPSYQKLALNSLDIIRGGKVINKLTTAKISLLNRETELENQIYNGSITLNILLDDVQVGDSISYSYTRYGDNPVYRGIFAYSRMLNWRVPVENQFVRVLWGKASPLAIDTRNITPDIRQNKLAGYTEYQVHMNNVDTLRSASELPNWYEPYGWISFSESQHWQDVVMWAETLYQASPLHDSIKAIANDIKRDNSTLAEQIAAALKYTQDDIRYVGLEMGVNSHIPTPAHETVILKYGDCKDKALLFIALLEALGVDAHPALVNTGETKLLRERLPAVNIFDHVIVSLVFDGKQMWLDPTLSHQEGPLEKLFQPDYGYALIVKSGEKDLTSMAHIEHNSYTRIRDSYVVPADVKATVSFDVESRYLGNTAQQKYAQIERDGKKKLTEDYEVYYQRTYPKLRLDQAIEITSEPTTGELAINESYLIDEFWKKGDVDYERSFYPSDIRNAVYKPKQVTRNDPLWFEFPNNITNQIVIKFEETGWDFDKSDFVEENPYFYFKRDVVFIDNILTLTFDFQSKTDHIPAEKVADYMAARDRLRAKAYYGITKYSEETKLKNEQAQAQNIEFSQSEWILVLAAIFLAGLIFIIVSWRIESKNRPSFSQSHYFPISVTKFLVLSIVTYGAYSAYWAYRNWKEIKQRQGSHIMPIARGIFIVFFYYPLFNALKKDSEDRFESNRVMLPSIAGLFAVLYLLFSVLSNIEETFISSMLLLLSPVFFIPLIQYINSLNNNEQDAYCYNSTWNLRTIITIVIFTPFFSYVILQQTPLLPSTNVISESGIMKHDMKYLYRQNVLPANETIQYFYSDAWFSVREDGSGFTRKRVFSYWQDELEGFQREIAEFDDIKEVKTTYAESEGDNTVITITRYDDSHFELFVSSFDDDDDIFVDELTSLWQAAKANK